MSNVIPPIQELCPDKRIWHVDWFGAVERNHRVPSEPTIGIIISPLSPSSAGQHRKVIHEERRVARVGVGQLPFVTVGSQWQDGRALQSQAGEFGTLQGVEISPDTVRVVASDHCGEHGWLIPRNEHQIGGHGLSAKCLAIRYGGDEFGIIIPIVEIIRFYYAVSTELAHALFAGAFRHDVNSVVREGTGYDSDRNVYVVFPQLGFSKNDCWVIARILHSPEAHKGAVLIHDSLMRSTAQDKPAYPVSAFPFSGRTSLSGKSQSKPTYPVAAFSC